MLMSFSILGLLGNLTETEKDQWAATINMFQDPYTGLFLYVQPSVSLIAWS
jgi:hypothetical protein